MIGALIALRATCILLGIWGLLNAAQWLATMRDWQDGGARGWDVRGLRRGRLYRTSATALLFAPAGLSALAGAQLAASAALILAPISGLTLVWLGGFGLATILLALRAGPDGADKLITVVTTGAILQVIGVVLGDQRIAFAGVLWTGGQLTIAYFASGASKLLIERWRNGDALEAVFTSYMWGHRWTAAIVRKRSAAQLVAWLVMLPEVLFPLVLLLPAGWLFTVLACFFLFHMAIAVVMGLNHYPWAFLAAYPSALLLSGWLRLALGLG